MIGGDSKLVLTCTHTHMFPHTHTQLISRNEKEIERSHAHSPNGGWDQGKKKKDHFKVELSKFSAGVDSLATPLGT